jgi:RimJ/RimL family protein N-acetyltransferase
LVGRRVRLDPLTEADIPELASLLVDPDLYRDGYVMHRQPATPADGAAVARERFLAGAGEMDGRGLGRAPYAVRLVAEGTLVGTTSLLEAVLSDERIHLGSTLYGRRWWGTAVNPEAKLLLLGHCFDDCGYGRVKLVTDLLNRRSQAAIERLGAQREGVLRRHRRREDGSFRDTVVYSILRAEWPGVRSGLLARLR